MSVGPFSTDSKAIQKTQNVSGSGQLNEKSEVAQGGSVLVSKGATLAKYDLSRAKLGKGASIEVNEGPSTDLLTDLVGKLSGVNVQPAPAPPSSSPTVITPTVPGPSGDDKPTTLNQLFDAAKNNPLIVVGILLALLVAAKIFRIGK